MRRKGFTLIELLLVVAILSVLLGIVVKVSTGALRSARTRRTEAMRVTLENAIATAYAQSSDGKWLPEIEAMASARQSGVLSEEAAQNVFRAIVKRSVGLSGAMNPLVDPNGLFVARKGIANGKGNGYGYADARQGDGKRRQGIGPDQMNFGFQGVNSGKFWKFNIIYNDKSDSVKVTTCCPNCASVDGCKYRYGEPCPYCHKLEGQ